MSSRAAITKVRAWAPLAVISQSAPPRAGVIPLEVSKLAVHYGTNEVISNVNFHVSRGDHIVIIGKNGAGKSSLLRCLAGVLD